MRLFLTSDSNWEAKIDHATRTLELREFFAERDYGPGLSGLSIILMCCDPDLNFRRRVRLDHKARRLYTDVMLDLNAMTRVAHSERRRIIAQQLLADIPVTIARYRLQDFDLPAFTEDFRHVIEDRLLGVEASRYDHLCLP